MEGGWLLCSPFCLAANSLASLGMKPCKGRLWLKPRAEGGGCREGNGSGGAYHDLLVLLGAAWVGTPTVVERIIHPFLTQKNRAPSR